LSTGILFILILLAVAAGAAFAWIMASAKSRKTQNQIENELRSKDSEVSQVSFERDQLRAENNSKEEELQTMRAEVVSLNRQLAESQASHKDMQRRLEEQKEEIEKLNEKFSTEFQNLANRIFEEKSKKFTDQNKEKLNELLNPLRERILEFQKRVEDTHTAGEKRGAALSEQLKNLRDLNQQITAEAKSLTMALRGDSKAQGNWGEMQLESILQKAGLQKDIHYSREDNFKTEEGKNQRLDFIIHLPDGKHLILDSKVSLSAYSRYFDTEDEDEQKRQLKDHLNSLYTHMKLLGEKNYQSLYGINPPDYVMMFIANEPALTIALSEDQQIFEKALDKNLVIVTPSTLMATLRTIAMIWNQDLQNRNAEEIARQAGALYDKFVGFTEDLAKIGNQLQTVQNTYTDSMKKLVDGRGNLVRRAEQLRELGAKTTKAQSTKFLDRAD
jgi:DNA recombination protein RmuC